MRADDLAFGTPDWSSGLDLEEILEEAPRDATVLGWAFNSVLRLAERKKVELPDYRAFTPFTPYPLHDYLRLLALAAERLDPQSPPRWNLFLLGSEVYPAFGDSLMGRMVSTALRQGAQARDTLKWLAQSYRLTSEHTRAEVVMNVDGRVIVHLSEVWSFPDVYHVGVFEGAARAISPARIRVRVCPVSRKECFIELVRRTHEATRPSLRPE